MCVKEWKRIAERETLRYRDYKAFQKGVEDAGGVVPERYGYCRRWTLAAEYALAYWDRNDAEKARFFRVYYGIDGQRRRTGQKGLVALSFEFCVSPSTLYEWRQQIRTVLVMAALQTGALRPFQTVPAP